MTWTRTVAREALWLVVAALVGTGLPVLLALPAQAELASTVRWAPVVLVALGRFGHRLGQPLPRRTLLLWLIWLPLAGVASRSGLPFGPPVAFTLYVGLIGGWIWSVREPLRRSLVASEPAHPPRLFFWLALTVYLAVTPWSAEQRPLDGDEPYYLLVAHSLAYDFDADLTNNYTEEDSRIFLHRTLEPQPGDPVRHDGSIFSRHNVLLAVVLTLPYRLAGLTGGLLTMALLAGLLAWWSLRLLRRTYPEARSSAWVLATWLLLSLLPPILLYGHQIWTEVPATFLLVVAFDAIQFPSARRVPKRLVAVVLLLPFLKFRFALLSGMLVVLAVQRRGTWRRMVPVALGLLAVGIGIASINLQLFGDILKHYSMADLRLDQRPLMSYVRAILGLYFDPAFGLVGCAPLWLLLLPAATLPEVRRSTVIRRSLWLLVPYFVLVTSRQEWFGGWSPPFRYALVALPFLSLALVPLLERPRTGGARFLLGFLGTATAVLTIAWLAVPGWTYNLADGGNHLVDALARRTDADLRRLLPSYVRTSAASWAWPLVLTVGSIGLWRSSRPRRSSALAGAAMVLLAGCALVTAGRAIPTRAIEFEDPQVAAPAESLYPHRWTVDRQNFRGGRILRQGEELSVPVVPGTQELQTTLAVRYIENRSVPSRLLLRDTSGRILASWTAERPDEWIEVQLGPFPWTAGERLVLGWADPGDPLNPNAVLLDRAELEWR